MANSDTIKQIKYIETFTSKINIDTDVTSIFLNPDEEKKNRSMKWDISLSLKTNKKFKGMLLSCMGLQGVSLDERVRCQCEVTGIFYVEATEDLDKIISEEKHSDELSSLTSSFIYPYLRNLALDMGKNLPLNALVRLAPEYSVAPPEKPAQKRKRKKE